MASLQRLLKESWTLVEDHADKLAGHFYARIFVLDPQLRDLFPIQMDAQRNRLLNAVVRAVQQVEDPERFADEHRALGRDHRKFHVQPEHHDVVRECLIDALARYAGEQWSPEYAQAWRDAYDAIAGHMVAGAAADETTGRPAFWHAEVLSHERRAHDIAVITARPFIHLPYHAGQYVAVETPYRPRLWRTYSIANAPRRDGIVEFHVRAVGAGWGSSALVWKLRQGDVIRLGAPMGRMLVDLRSTRDVLCIAGGTGLAPLKAIAEEVCRGNRIRTDRPRHVHLFFGAKTEDELYDLRSLMMLTKRHPWLTVVPAVSGDPDYAGRRGEIAAVALRHGTWRRHDVYVSGSPIMVRNTLNALNQAGIPPTRVRYDAFADL
ncbi:MAG: globin domain-containing protein [Micromonosporaceae bacterium]